MSKERKGRGNVRSGVVIAILCVVAIMLAAANLATGAVEIPLGEIWNIITGKGGSDAVWELIVMQSRLPLIATAALSCGALAIAGLLMQTLFNNPLADPSILGVSSGSSLGVAIVMLLLGGELGTLFGTTVGGYVSILAGAMAGAALILAALMLFSSLVKGTTMLLIVGIMISFLASSAISLLNFFSTQEGVHSYVIWGLGNFSGVTMGSLPLFSMVILFVLAWSMLLVKPLNALLLGSRYAESLGVNLRRVRNVLLLVTGILTATVTAFCGPIGFIGLVVPHIARLMLNSSDHRVLMPCTMLAGVVVALLCQFVSVLPTSVGIIPINAITPIVGVPIIIYIILNRKKIKYFN